IQLNRRRPGQNHLTTPRQEPDQVVCLSGMEDQKTLGTPLTLIVYNQDKKPEDYSKMSQSFRPSHADFTTQIKYGIRAKSGGGRSSARETIARVISGAVAEQILEAKLPQMKIIAWVESIHSIRLESVDFSTLSRQKIDQYITRCPDDETHKKMEQVIIEAKKKGDSVGGVIRCIVLNPPIGLGSPVFDKLEAELAKAMMSLPATKGFEIGSGFNSTTMFGSQHNDEFFIDADGAVRTKTNNSGGIQGGISNGEVIDFRVAFKPVATIYKEQQTISEDLTPTTLKPEGGRHDPCVLPRAVPIVEAMTAHVLLDQLLIMNNNKMEQL
ncbi:chorismate synthase, partial [Dolichospermum sp. ST_sed1]|nr:chorismate synthase [Dolichospermum sp. ST_sed1]